MENRKLPKLDLNITNRCNFRCTHCAFDSGIAEMSELTLSEIKKILEETRELGGQRFDITGGEPLVREDVEEIIRIGKDLGYRIELVTNGSLLNDDNLARFKDLGLDDLAISLDGSTPEIYNRIRRKDEETFYKVLENIRKAKKSGFSVKINTVLFSCNIEDIENIAKLALELKVNELGLYYFTPVGRGCRSLELSAELLRVLRLREELKKYLGKGMKISYEVPMIEKETWKSEMGCLACNEKSHLQILPDGNVYPCAILASYGKPIANLKQTSIREIWNNNQLWADYWKDISRLFKGFNGYCVDFRCFNIGSYKNYKFICPLRKFKLGEVK